MSTPLDMTIDLLIEVCAAPTVEAAAGIGGRLGWHRSGEAQLGEWRRHFLAYNGGTVDDVGWHRAGESLSFWIAVGPNGHKACAYSTVNRAGLLEALSERLGKPDDFEQNQAIESVRHIGNGVQRSIRMLRPARLVLSTSRGRIEVHSGPLQPHASVRPKGATAHWTSRRFCTMSAES